LRRKPLPDDSGSFLNAPSVQGCGHVQSLQCFRFLACGEVRATLYEDVFKRDFSEITQALGMFFYFVTHYSLSFI
jgi:hypothetical protein